VQGAGRTGQLTGLLPRSLTIEPSQAVLIVYTKYNLVATTHEECESTATAAGL
jgi:hypothetical protein